MDVTLVSLASGGGGRYFSQSKLLREVYARLRTSLRTGHEVYCVRSGFTRAVRPSSRVVRWEYSCNLLVKRNYKVFTLSLPMVYLADLKRFLDQR